MTTKTTKTILFASLIAAMILPFSGMSFVDAEEAPIDTRDYFSEALVVFDENKKLQKEIDNESKEISASIEKSKTAKDSEKLKIANDIKEKKNNKKAKENKVKNNEKTIEELEAKSIKAHTVSPKKQAQYTAIEEAFYEEYLSSTTSTDGNPTEAAFIDPQFRKLVVIVSPTEIDSFGLHADSLISEYMQFIRNMPGNDLTVELEYGKFTNTACSARDASCNPVYAGLSVSNEDEIGTGFSTMSYKAKLGSTVGFIMTAHGAGGSNKDIVQPDDINRVIGNVDAYQDDSHCDCAFVDIGAYTVDNDIYKNSSTSYSITGEVADSSQTVWSWVYKSGAGTGVVLGQIRGNLASNDHNLLYIYNGAGDSGAAIFDIDSGNDVDLYGMAYAASSGSTGMRYVLYYPWDHINSELGTSLS